MPTITHTPEPYSSTAITATGPNEILIPGTTYDQILITPATTPHAGREGDPIFVQLFPANPRQTPSRCYTYSEISDLSLPAPLEALVLQTVHEYQRTGPVPAVPPLTPQAERARSGYLGLGTRSGKGRWS